MFAREIPDKETALSAILEELEKRYGEKFHQLDSKDIKSFTYEQPRNGVQYIATLAPDTSPEKIFSGSIDIDAHTHKQWGNILDNYQQHIFDPIVCTPFREYLQLSPHVDGYSVRLSWNKMDSKVWKKEQVEEYMGKGIDGDPEIHMTIVIPRDTKDNLAKVIYAFHKDLSEFKRNMQLRVGMTGTDPRTVNELYLTLVLSGSVKCLAELHDVDLSGTKSRSYGRRWICLTSRDLKLYEVNDLFSWHVTSS